MLMRIGILEHISQNLQYECSICWSRVGWVEAVGHDPHPLENHKAIGFLGKTGPDPLENQKHSMFGPS